MLQKINLSQKFGLFQELWSPKIAGRVGDCHLKLGKVKGEFIWHKHDDQEEMFMVHQGKLCVELRDGSVWLEPGELLIIPKGVEHRPVAPQEAWIVMFEPVGTLNTGDLVTDETRQELEQI